MRNIRLIVIGKSQEPFVKDGIRVYLKKLSHYINVDYVEITESLCIINSMKRAKTKNFVFECLGTTELKPYWTRKYISD